MATIPPGDIPTRPLGRTGERVSIVGLDGWHLGLPHGLPTSIVITGCDTPDILAQAVRVARRFRPTHAKERARLLARTAEAAATGECELFTTTAVDDGTAEHPERLGEEPERSTDTKQA